MPAEARDQRRAQRLENARRWGQWLTQAMAQERIEPKDIVNGSDNAINKGDISHWLNGDNSASADNAVIVAQILRRSPTDALLAAGHPLLAKAMMNPREAELRALLDDLDRQIDAKLDELKAAGEVKADREAGEGGENGDRGAS